MGEDDKVYRQCESAYPENVDHLFTGKLNEFINLPFELLFN